MYYSNKIFSILEFAISLITKNNIVLQLNSCILCEAMAAPRPAVVAEEGPTERGLPSRGAHAPESWAG